MGDEISVVSRNLPGCSHWNRIDLERETKNNIYLLNLYAFHLIIQSNSGCIRAWFYIWHTYNFSK